MTGTFEERCSNSWQMDVKQIVISRETTSTWLKNNSNHSCKTSTFLQSNHQLVGGFNHLEKYESQWKE